MPTIEEQNETIRQQREARYTAMWPTVYDQIEYMSRHGGDSIFIEKDKIRQELPYVE